MDWIKRNLMFVIGAAVSLGLLGVAGWYSWSGYSHNATEKEQLNTQYVELKRLTNLKPNPGDGTKVNNIKLAQEQQKEALTFQGKLAQRLARIPTLPEGANLVASEYSAALQRTIDELQREATNHSVILPPKYKFSFEAQAGRVTFAGGSLVPLAAQLGEVRAICLILNEARINALDGVRRVRVSEDDKNGPATDYLEQPSVTNELAVSVPYEVTIRCFTPELASVIEGFANSPHGLIIKGLNVETAPAMVMSDSYGAPIAVAVPVLAQPVPRSGYGEGEARSRYSARPMAPTPAPAPTPLPQAVASQARTGLQTFLTEKQLKVTLLIHVVKLQPQT